MPAMIASSARRSLGWSDSVGAMSVATKPNTRGMGLHADICRSMLGSLLLRRLAELLRALILLLTDARPITTAA
jgi:hypothetical protein